MSTTRTTTDKPNGIASSGRPLTRPQVARLLGVGVATVQRWIDSGELAAKNLAADLTARPRLFIMPAALEDFLERRGKIDGAKRLPKRPRRHEGPPPGAEYFQW